MIINNLTKYRTELMGFAILWVMFFHSGIVIPDFLLPLEVVKRIGYAGVDIFFLLSGVGLAFSLSKVNSTGEYLYKRVTRIVPTFWVILIIYAIKDIVFHEFDVVSIFIPFLGLDFLLFGTLTFWFIPAIFICYLIAPIYFPVLKKYQHWLVLLLPVAAAVMLSQFLLGTSLSHLVIFTVRIPVFLFGLYISLLLVEKKYMNILNNMYINGVVLFFSTSILVVLITNTESSFRWWYTELWWYSTIIMAFPLCVLLAYLLNKPYRLSAAASKFFKLFGSYTLELYLIHILIFKLVQHFGNMYTPFVLSLSKDSASTSTSSVRTEVPQNACLHISEMLY